MPHNSDQPIYELPFSFGDKPPTKLKGYELRERPGDALDITLGGSDPPRPWPGFGPSGFRRFPDGYGPDGPGARMRRGAGMKPRERK